MFGTVQPAAPFDDVVSDDADTMIHFEHPARAEEFAAVAVLATLAYAADETGSALPPLWPMMLHSSFTDLILPVPGAAADASSSDAASIPELIRALRSLIHRHQHGGALGMRRVLYLRWDAVKRVLYRPGDVLLIDDIIATAAVPLLARLLGSGAAPHATQFEAAWALAMVASSGKSTHVQCVANTPGAIKGIVSLLGSTDHHDACEHAVGALSNIAGKSSNIHETLSDIRDLLLGISSPGIGKSSVVRDLLLESGVVAAMANVASQTDLPKSLRRDAAWTISHLCSSKRPPVATIAAAIPFLIEMSQSPDDDFVNSGMQGLRSITSVHDRFGISAVIEHGALPVIMRRLSSANNTVDFIDAQALNCLGNIVEGSERHIAQAVEHGAIPALCTVWRKRWRDYDSSKPIVLRILAKIATGNMDHIHALLQAGALDLMAAGLTSGALHREYQRTVGIALRDASHADCAAIIQSTPTPFQWLISAAQEGHLTLAGVEGLAVAFERAFDTITMVVSPRKLSWLMATLSRIEKAEAQGPIDRVRAVVARRRRL
jgi:uncharacterized protein (UPF0147 family)